MSPTDNLHILVFVILSIILTSKAAKTKLPTAEGCNDTNFNICGGDQSKYPTDSINGALSRNEDLKSAVLTLRKFFGPEKPQFRTAEVETLDKLACTATRKKIPRDARAKNINGKWRYLVQNGEGNIQEVEWVTCDNTEESHCRTGEFDSPFGKKWTRCKQIFSIRKLLAIDEDGVISVDSFELPSACLCEYSEPEVRGIDDPFEMKQGETTCKASEKPLDVGTITLSEGGILTSSYLKDASEKIVPCSDSKSYCEENISEYGNEQIDALLSPHLQQEYFNKVFTGHTEKACQKTSEKVIGQTARAEDDFLSGEKLCGYTENHLFPTKGKSSTGTWKYIINTEKYQQVVSTQTCQHFTDEYQPKSCLYAGETGRVPEATECKQLYWNQELLSVSEDGSIEFDTFIFPSFCACHIIDESYL